MSLLGSLLDARLSEAFTSPAAADAYRSLTPEQRKRARTTKLRPAGGSGGFDESKHKRAAAGAREGGRFVSKGSSGADVKAVQRSVGVKRDGQFGERTRAAVVDFQRRHGLRVDGVVGHQTALAMSGRLKAARRAKVGALTKADRSALRRATVVGGKLMLPERGRGGVVV